MLVSVIIPCFNQGSYLNESLESVLNQTDTDWECIIVDDGSTDETKSIAKEWTLKDNRFKYYYKENGGVSSARNFGIEKASGLYLQFLDCDDILDKEKIELSLNQFKLPNYDDLKMVISNFEMISSDSKTISPAFCKLHKDLFTLDGFLFQWNITFSIQIQCGFFNASLFENIRFPENLSAQEDWVVWVQLMKMNQKLVFIDMPLALYRRNPTSRMRTLGIDDNQIKVLDSFKEILTIDEYHKLSKHLLSNYIDSNGVYKRNLQRVKNSNTYQTGLMIKKILRKFRLLKPARKLFKIILKLKANYYAL